jgi:catechol 2,3-dioxygenase-like lactoylglutathione lyase family enzyme
MPMLRVKALDHVGLVVTDLDRSLRFYVEGLGLELLRWRECSDGTSSAVLKVGDQEINVFSNPNFIAGTNELHRIDHFCLMMESATMSELVAALREAGLEIAEGPSERRDGAAVLLHDPDGVRVELQIKNSG